MNRRMTYVGVFILSFLLIHMLIFWWFIWKINPSHHFTVNPPPILAPKLNDTILRDAQVDLQFENELINDLKREAEEPYSSINILIMGIDGTKYQYSRTDVILVAHVKLNENKINLLSIPRDTQVNINGIGETKINHAHSIGELKKGIDEGTLATIAVVQDLLDIEINYFIKLNFDSFVHLVDKIDGIEIDLHYQVGKFTVGEQHLDGEETLEFVRERYSLPNGDHDRQVNQVLVLKAIAKKILRPREIIKLPKLVEHTLNIMDTNLRTDDILSLSTVYKDINELQLDYFQVPGYSKRAHDPLVKKKLYYWIADREKLIEMAENHFKK